MFSVNYWDTHPDLGEDTHCTGEDFPTLEEARAAFDNPNWKHGHYVELTGEGIYEVKMRPGHDPKRAAREAAAEDLVWRREMAMEAGMTFGVEAYNEYMGWD